MLRVWCRHRQLDGQDCACGGGKKSKVEGRGKEICREEGCCEESRCQKSCSQEENRNQKSGQEKSCREEARQEISKQEKGKEIVYIKDLHYNFMVQ